MNIYDERLANDGRILHHLGLMLQRDEHGVKSPQSTVHSPELVVRCAWCDREQNLKADMLKAERVSHGICERHAAAMRSEIEQMHSERRAA